MFDPSELTLERFDTRQERAIRQGGFSHTDKAQAIIRRYMAQVISSVTLGLEELSSSKSNKNITLKELLEGLKPEVLALALISSAMDCVATNLPPRTIAKKLGTIVEDEAFALKFRSADEKEADRLADFVKKRNSGMKSRRTAFRSLAAKKGHKARPWTDENLRTVGAWGINRLCDSDAFMLVEPERKGDTLRFCLTEEALEHAEAFVARLLEARPVFAPVKQRQAPWTSLHREIETHGGKFRASLVRADVFMKKHVHRVMREAIDAGQMQPVLEAVSAISDTAWKLNPFVVDLVEWAYEENLACGIPPKNDIAMPDRVDGWLVLSPEMQAFHRKTRANIKGQNRSNGGKRTALRKDLTTAHWLGSDTFWTPANLDYRGRVYHLCGFNFQRPDYVRGMFKFADGEVLGTSGLYWLKVHLANCGDFQKVSKASFDERIAWVDANHAAIMEIASDPKSNLLWTEADSPFMFAAACHEYANAYLLGADNYVCSLPVNWDGSCSGIQHLCAMTRAPEGILVNLGYTEQANDIYKVVADKLIEVLKAERDPEKIAYANMALAYGVDRKFVKRQVMTYAYSSNVGGMKDQITDDLMKPLQNEVIAGLRTVHPFGDNWPKAAGYFASVIYRTIETVVQYPAQAMKFLQKIAAAAANENRHYQWTTPLGFPVLLYKREETASKVQLTLGDHKYQTTVYAETMQMDKAGMRSAVAPNFVHSYDACHLMMVTNACVKEGITSIALVHDSFGCLPSRAERFRNIILEQFVTLYQTDVLKDALDEAKSQLDDGSRLPETFPYGTLMINEVMHARYAFA